MKFWHLSTLLVFCGCTTDTGVELRTWKLTSQGSTMSVTVPAHLSVAPEEHTYRLETVAQTTESSQRCLLLPWLQAEIEVRFDNLPIKASNTELTTTAYRARGPHLLCASQLSPGSHKIELLVHHTWTQSSWLEGTPRILSQEAAVREWQWRDMLTFWTFATASIGNLGVGLTYALMFFMARRRRDFGWFAIQALGSLSYPLFVAGFTRALGPIDQPILASVLTVGTVSSVYFTHEVFKLGRVSRVFLVLLAITVLFSILFSSPFEHAAFVVGTFSIGVVVVYQIVRLTRLSLKRSMNAMVFLSAWVLLGCLTITDQCVWLGLAPWAEGLRLGGVGLVGFMSLQVIGLSREFLNTLGMAEEKAALLQKQQVEVQRLNTELKFQIAQRSKELADALGKLGEVEGHLLEGALVGTRYRVNGFIGAGAMGRVYNVTRTTDEVHFALKVMSEVQTGSSAVRFAREAQILSSVSHENIVSVVDAGVDERGLLFLVLELVIGTSLDQCRPLHADVSFGLEVVRQVAAGLAGLHESRIVHRDLKPGNILVANSPSGVKVKLTDFGISTVLSNPSSQATPTGHDSWLGSLGGSLAGNLTQTGTVLGTPSYIAPELAGTGSTNAGPSSDVFSMGIIAYELLTGRRPWEEPPIVLKLKGLASAPLDLGEACPSLPLEVAHILMRALSWDPLHRPSAAEVAHIIVPQQVMLPDGIAVRSDQAQVDQTPSLQS
jgi:hypothetical protein